MNNRLHLLSAVNADDTYDGSTHVMYAYSNDGGDTFFRRDGSQIASLPIRVTGPTENRGSVLMTQGIPDEFDASYFGLFWDDNYNPAFSYRLIESQPARLCYYDNASQQSIAADFNIPVSLKRSDHYSLPDGSMLIIGTSEFLHKESFTDPGTVYSLSDPGIPSGQYLLSEVDDKLLRDRSILRGITEKNGRGVIISVDLKRAGFPTVNSARVDNTRLP